MANKTFDSRLEDNQQDSLGSSLAHLFRQENFPGIDRRAFLMRSAMIDAMGVITGRRASAQQVAASAKPKGVAGGPGNVELAPTLAVVQRTKEPVLTTTMRVTGGGRGPSSSHMIDPMRITYDFYRRCTKLPADQLDEAGLALSVVLS